MLIWTLDNHQQSNKPIDYEKVAGQRNTEKSEQKGERRLRSPAFRLFLKSKLNLRIENPNYVHY